ncbi:MAG: hypothetical protein AAFS02_11765 [Pseudomonadota bacterium]
MRGVTTSYRHLAAGAALVFAAGAAQGATSEWWDTDWGLRRNVAVSTGPVAPDKGYAGYTLRVSPLDTQSLIAAGELQNDCDDLRIVYFNGTGWQDLPRHVIGCNTAQTDIRFAAPIGLPNSATNDDFYLYYDNASAPAPVALSTTNVYLWYDDASVNRAASYVRGRVDPWHGSGWDNTLAWNAAGYYTYRNGDNFTSGYRRAVDERDVFIEAEFFHVDCFPINMTTGVLVRGIIQSGSGGSENSNHYYASNRGEFPQSGCGNANGYTHDGAIMRRQRNQIAVQNGNPGDIVPNQWRRQALAAFGANPTSLRFWDEDSSAFWAADAFPNAGNLQAQGTDNQNVTNRGFVAVMTAQDQARLRNIYVRRYVEPEPVAALGGTESIGTPNLTVFKTVATQSDPVNGGSGPFDIPGAVTEYEIRVENSGAGPVDGDSLVITEPLPAGTDLVVADIAPGAGPVRFEDGLGASSSGLSLSFLGLGNGSDDIEFSTDGVNFNYTPVADAAGTDPAVRFLRIRPSGAMAGAPSGSLTTFSVFFRVRIR